MGVAWPTVVTVLAVAMVACGNSHVPSETEDTGRGDADGGFFVGGDAGRDGGASIRDASSADSGGSDPGSCSLGLEGSAFGVYTGSAAVMLSRPAVTFRPDVGFDLTGTLFLASESRVVTRLLPVGARPGALEASRELRRGLQWAAAATTHDGLLAICAGVEEGDESFLEVRLFGGAGYAPGPVGAVSQRVPCLGLAGTSVSPPLLLAHRSGDGSVVLRGAGLGPIGPPVLAFPDRPEAQLADLIAGSGGAVWLSRPDADGLVELRAGDPAAGPTAVSLALPTLPPGHLAAAPWPEVAPGAIAVARHAPDGLVVVALDRSGAELLRSEPLAPSGEGEARPAVVATGFGLLVAASIFGAPAEALGVLTVFLLSPEGSLRGRSLGIPISRLSRPAEVAAATDGDRVVLHWLHNAGSNEDRTIGAVVRCR